MTSEAYQVIARRWRPQLFSELAGQNHIVQTLTNAIAENRIAHAYLFVGPRGTGKTSMARIFAKALNCTGGPSITPPADCPICKAIVQGHCLDVVEIDGASNNSVEQIRSLREECQYAPAECRYKIYIIDEVHMLSGAAFNALLKILEEPPAHVKFIFATTEAHKVLPTITSRCQRFEFRPISAEIIEDKLRSIAQAEGLQVEDNVFKAIARMAQGGMRDAQSILEQLVAFCGTTVTLEAFLKDYGLPPESVNEGLLAALENNNSQGIVAASDALESMGCDFYQALSHMQEIVHERLIDALRAGKKVVHLTNAKKPANTGIPATSVMRAASIFKEGLESLKYSFSQKTTFELTCFKALETLQERPIDSLLEAITQMATNTQEALNTTDEKKKPVVQVRPNYGSIDTLPQLQIQEAASAHCSLSLEAATFSLEEAKGKLCPSTQDILERIFRAEFKLITEK